MASRKITFSPPEVHYNWDLWFPNCLALHFKQYFFLYKSKAVTLSQYLLQFANSKPAGYINV